MKARISLLTAALLTLGVGARSASAQASATASGPGSYVTVGGGISDFQADYGQRWLGGGMAFVDINPTWRYGIEAEARYLRYNTDEDVTETNYLAGLRVAIIRPRFHMLPYGKFLVGAGHASLPYGDEAGTVFTYAPGAGVDVEMSDRFAFRLDGEYQMWPNFGTFGSLHPYGITAGISFRLNGVSPFPTRGSSMRKH